MLFNHAFDGGILRVVKGWGLRYGRKERAEGEGKGVYEAYEVKNKREKLRCLLLRRKKKIIYFIFMK